MKQVLAIGQNIFHWSIYVMMEIGEKRCGIFNKLVHNEKPVSEMYDKMLKDVGA